MNSPQLSIIMPAFNSGKYIREAIFSVLNQTFHDFELIVINDGSTDNTREIIHSFTDDRIKYFENLRNMGIVFSRNKGLELVSGKFIGMVDSDDIIYPEKFQKQIDFLKNNPKYDMVGAWARFIDEDGNRLPGGWKLNAPSNLIPSIMLFKNYFLQSAVVYRHECIKNFTFKEGFDILEDYLLWIEFLENHKAYNYKGFLLKYRIHNLGVTKDRAKERIEKEKKVFKIQLEKIGIIPNERELDLHMLIRDASLINDIAILNEIEVWLLKILHYNNLNQVYGETELKKVIYNRWLKSCYKARKIKLRMILKFFTSRLSYLTLFRKFA